MNTTVYDMMDWARIEALVYSEEDSPHDFLGAHMTEDGLLIQAYIPAARQIAVLIGDDEYPMEKEDDSGFFAVLLDDPKFRKTSGPVRYRFGVSFEDGRSETLDDPYRFAPVITQKDTAKFNAGIHYQIYEKLGAHLMTIDGVKGVHFAVWAPNAMRVSVVGDFNEWDGRALQMRRLWDSGIFELFVPGLAEGTLYKYEIKAKGGLTYLKADPYANRAELRPNSASIVTSLSGYEWTDDNWMKSRDKKELLRRPMAVYEVHLGSFTRSDSGMPFLNYRELAPKIADHVRKTGYTHVELLPVMEHPLDESGGYQISGYYAPTARYGSPKDLMFFMNYMHKYGIGVILDWCPAQFAPDDFCLRGFDGTCLYEHQDPRQGVNPALGTLIFNLGRPEVKNFLIGSALFWAKVYHADGLRMDSVSQMLYLDFGRNDGQWVANMYGGNENLEAVEFIKHLNSIMEKENEGCLMIAEETTGYPKVTAPLSEDGLGFDLKWDNGWSEDFVSYMELDPIFRGPHQGDLTFSMIYHYSEQFLLALSHNEVTAGRGSMLMKMPGRKENKFANLRAAYGYQMMHPGKKLQFMGDEIASIYDWKAGEPVDWSLTDKEEHAQLYAYVRDLLKLYRSQPALSERDYETDGFEWINSISANENMLVFLRKTEKEEETLLVVVNFSNVVYDNHKIGVPFPGKYKEIFNSDAAIYGGKGNINPRVRNSRKDECDMREDSVRIIVPPLGICVFSCTRSEKAVSANDTAKVQKTRKTSGRRPASTKKTTAKKVSSDKEESLKDQLARKVEEEENKG